MKTFKDLNEWLSSNPSKDELNKVMGLINRGAVSNARREVYLKEQYLRKLQRIVVSIDKLNIEVPKSYIEEVRKTKSEIETLRKGLPIPPKRIPKAKVIEPKETEK